MSTRWDGLNQLRVGPDNDFKKEGADFVVVSAIVEGQSGPQVVYARLAAPRLNGRSVEIFGRFGKDDRDRQIKCRVITFKKLADVRKLFGELVEHPCVKVLA
ncbi:MAG: hypothetical protein WC457_03970 [Patescibacteria group bacterium]|jgi:hypothetical protein